MSSTDEIYYRDRETGALVAERSLNEAGLRWVYGSRVGLRLFNGLANNRPVCWCYGKFQDSALSRFKIRRFVEQYGIDPDEVEYPPEQYRSFNAFFTRRLRDGARSFAEDPNAFCAPADGKVRVYPRLDSEMRMPVKGALLTAEALLACRTEARRYLGGAALVVRLAPYDYHRFHFPDDGTAGGVRPIGGQYHSVHPLALARVPDVFLVNKRTVTAFASDHFGPIAYVEVGAFTVARIVQTYVPGRVCRGQEKGYFCFGGSTLVLLFEPGRLAFDEDLLRDSASEIEVQVKAGSRIGRRG